jgi:hypothetical protein
LGRVKNDLHKETVNHSQEDNHLFILGLIIIGFIGGVMLASTGMIGPFLVPALLILGLPSDVARGTVLVSELLMTLVSVIGHRKAKHLDRYVILAYLPGAITVVLGANVSLEFPEQFMKLATGAFEIIIGVVIIYTTLKLATVGSKNEQNSEFSIKTKTVVKLMIVAIFAGFIKGFFGAGWGPLGVGLFILLGIDPDMVIGSSLVIRLLLDCTGGLTYVSMGMVDVNTAIVLILAGCSAAPLGVKVTSKVSDKSLRILLGVIITFLGALVFI